MEGAWGGGYFFQSVIIVHVLQSYLTEYVRYIESVHLLYVYCVLLGICAVYSHIDLTYKPEIVNHSKIFL